uniref:carbohydrate deacetylase-like n=1 Tax=Styela clava TaxID=7725 RepID=UPI001939EDF5|nr:carbohydrate deacetylase-like [Styela clava]
MKRVGKLLINADDLGYNEERDRGIFQCFYRDNSITSASILANGSTSQTAIVQALRIGIPVGLHFNITEGHPLVEPSKIPSLVQKGMFLGKEKFVKSARSSYINPLHVKQELKAQINWFKRVSGSYPIRVDGHQHAHIMPLVRDAFCEVLNEYGITQTRLPLEEDIVKKDLGLQNSFFKYVDECSKDCLTTFLKYDIKHTDKFIGSSTMGINMSFESLRNLLLKAFTEESLNTKCELMVHPGFRCAGEEGGCGQGPDDFSRSKYREHEMAVLRNQRFKKFLEDQNIDMVSIKDICEESPSYK